MERKQERKTQAPLQVRLRKHPLRHTHPRGCRKRAPMGKKWESHTKKWVTTRLPRRRSRACREGPEGMTWDDSWSWVVDEFGREKGGASLERRLLLRKAEHLRRGELSELFRNRKARPWTRESSSKALTGPVDTGDSTLTKGNTPPLLLPPPPSSSQS